MGNKRIQVGDLEISVPEYYEQFESVPEGFDGSVAIAARSENAACLVLMGNVDTSDAPSFMDTQSIVDHIHANLDDDQGLIEVASGGEEGNRYAYSILKRLLNPEIPEGVQYILMMNKECDGRIIQLQGYFEECGTTGLRDSMVFQLHANKDGFDETVADWRFDPYDSDYKRGFLMNKSELEEYDELFPLHPLSMAREFVRTVLTN